MTRTPGHDDAPYGDSNFADLATHSPVIENFGHIWWHADSAAHARLVETTVRKPGKGGGNVLTPTKLGSFSRTITWCPTRRNATAQARPAAPPPTMTNRIWSVAFFAVA